MADDQVFNLKEAFRLENLITVNRDKLELRYSLDHDFADLHGKINGGIHKSELSKWAFITIFEKDPKERAVVFLTGRLENGMPTMTTFVTVVDFDQKLVRTKSGSLYRLIGDQAEIPLSMERTATIAATFNAWGLGQRLGMPPAFF